MKCQDCKDWDGEFDTCSKPFSEMENMVCLLKTIAWQIDFLFGGEDEEDKGEDWKKEKDTK